jgi:hypothetical protein
MADRAEKRREAIALGLRAAEEREKVAEEMRSNADVSGGHSEPGSHVITAMLGPDSQASASGQTLGSAAMAVPMVDRRRGWTVAVAAIVGVAVVAAIVAFVIGSSRPAAVATPPPPVTVVLPSIPPPPTDSAAFDVSPAASSASEASSASPATQGRAPLRWVPARLPPAASAARPASTSKTRVNDGF